MDLKRTLKQRAAEVRADFERNGVSIAQWAVANNLNSTLVYEVLRGNRSCVRGESHRAAVLLGLKDGAVGDPKNFRPLKEAA